MNRWKWILSAAVLGGIGGLLRSKYERQHFVVEETIIVSAKIKKPKTLVFLSDLHDNEFGHNNETLLAAIKLKEPDVILIGGDTMVTKKGQWDLRVTKHLLYGLVKLCPVFYGNGNHEQRLQQERNQYGNGYKLFLNLLQETGVHYLCNTSKEFGKDLVISGINIEKAYYKDFHPAIMKEDYLDKYLGKASEDRFQILLAHSPLFLEAYTNWGADLTLSGHFHGGTVRLPFLGGVMTPQFQFFLPCSAGTFQRKGRYLMVSRGLGTHSVNIRFGNQPQVMVIKLQPKDSN